MMHVFKRITVIMCVLCTIGSQVQSASMSIDDLRTLRNAGKFEELFTRLRNDGMFNDAVSGGFANFHTFIDRFVKAETFFSMPMNSQDVIDSNPVFQGEQRVRKIIVASDDFVSKCVDNAKQAIVTTFIPSAVYIFDLYPAVYTQAYRVELVEAIRYATGQFVSRVPSQREALIVWQKTVIRFIDLLLAQFDKTIDLSTLDRSGLDEAPFIGAIHSFFPDLSSEVTLLKKEVENPSWFVRFLRWFTLKTYKLKNI